MALDRILETEVLNTEKDAIEHDGMDEGDAHLKFALHALELAPPSGKVLDMGTGTARIPILMLTYGGKGLSMCAADLSREMLKVAKRNVEVAKLEGRIVLQLVDAKHLPFPPAEYDLVISNNLAHHIPEPADLFSEIVRVVRPDGGILVRDYMRPGTTMELELLMKRYAGHASEHQRKLFHDSLRAALTIPELHDCLKKAGLKDVTVVQCSDRHWSVEKQASAGR
jgi:ubiquinone/menaquinone biosynthesis C-methylase UbiE